MAGTSLLALIDDIASLLDDVATLTKVATKKTAGVLGDDLALNAEQVAGVAADRELPVVWAVAKGSMKNKAILVPGALAIVAVAEWLVTPLLMFGGTFLCYEGFEKISHKLLHNKAEGAEQHQKLARLVADPEIDLVALERDKIKGAVRTDFILSAEIIVISLGSLTGATFGTRVAVLVAIAAIMTVGVYGLVAGIVKLDDIGAALRKRASKAAQLLGTGLLRGAPYLMKFLSIAGTMAMFLVGGGIINHGIHALADVGAGLARFAATVPVAGGVLAWLAGPLFDAFTGLVVGAIALVLVTGATRLWKLRQRKAPAA